MSAAANSAPDAEYLVELRFPARANRMGMVRDIVRSAARFCGFDEPATRDIVLAVGEACQNVILHAYEGRGDGPILLDIMESADRMILRVTDFGPAVAPTRGRPGRARRRRSAGSCASWTTSIRTVRGSSPPSPTFSAASRTRT